MSDEPKNTDPDLRLQRSRIKTNDFYVAQQRDLRKAQTLLKHAQKFFNNGLYFDCLSRLEESMQ